MTTGAPAAVATVMPSAAPTPTATAVTSAPPATNIVTSPCDGSHSVICEQVYAHTHHAWAADIAQVVITRPLPIVAILLAAVVSRFLLHRTIDRVVRTAIAGPGLGLQRLGPRTRRALADIVPGTGERRTQRAQSLASVLRSISTVVVYTTALVMVLNQLGVNLAPLIASASILGVALGFGSQSLVRDVLTGVLLLLEDQYGVGDVVQIDSTTGVVEAIGLRTTRIRDVRGCVWHIRAGDMSRIGNFSQEWARALLDVTVSDRCDLDEAFDVISAAAASVAADPDFADLILEEPQVWGLEDCAPGALTVRLVVKTAPLKQWDVSRELRRALRVEFAKAGLEFGVPRQSLSIENGPAARLEGPEGFEPRRVVAGMGTVRSGGRTSSQDPLRQ